MKQNTTKQPTVNRKSKGKLENILYFQMNGNEDTVYQNLYQFIFYMPILKKQKYTKSITLPTTLGQWGKKQTNLIANRGKTESRLEQK